jgi:ParB-like chromosome segregation protein Spo0J
MATAFSAAGKNRLDLSVGIALGSASQIALFVAPVLVGNRGGLIAGHGRLLAAKSIGLDTVPSIVRSGLCKAQKAASRLVDAGGEAPGDADSLLDLTQRQQAAIGRDGAAVEAGDDRLALDG